LKKASEMPVTLPAARSLELYSGIIADMWGTLLKRDHIKGNGLAFCGFLYQAIEIMSSYDNAQRPGPVENLGEK
jgi:hypothetical protein